MVNEALSYGCPAIVSTRCGCVADLIIEDKTGWTHKTGNVEDLVSKMMAAPVWFSNVEQTANDCLSLMANFTPDKAAEHILDGCRKIMKGI